MVKKQRVKSEGGCDCLWEQSDRSQGQGPVTGRGGGAVGRGERRAEMVCQWMNVTGEGTQRDIFVRVSG